MREVLGLERDNRYTVSGDRRKDVVRHLSDEELDRLLAEADDPKVVHRLTVVKNLYEGDTLEEAANRVGKSESTGSRWGRRWNEGGLSTSQSR